VTGTAQALELAEGEGNAMAAAVRSDDLEPDDEATFLASFEMAGNAMISQPS
jgi:hypothetical protein